MTVLVTPDEESTATSADTPSGAEAPPSSPVKAANPRMDEVATGDWILVMSRKYEIHSGRRRVSTRLSSSPLEAATDYVRMFGSSNEIRVLGVDTVSWRGASFTAVPVPDEPEPSSTA